MFNPFSLNRMWQYFFYPTYSFLPLIILMAFKVVNNFNKKNLFLLSFLSMIFSTSPLGVIWIFFIILSISIYFTAFEKNIEKTKILFYFLFFYLLFNLFWILPYILSSFERNVVPSYFGTPAFSSTQLGLFSEYSNFLDSIRLLSGWGIPMRDFYPISQFWILVSMIIPITIISFFLFQKNVSSLYFFLIFLITLFLSKGVNLPFSFFYEFLTFYIPQIGWVFRDPSRWLIMISISYSIFIGNLFWTAVANS